MKPATFGQVSQTRGPRLIQFALKFYYGSFRKITSSATRWLLTEVRRFLFHLCYSCLVGGSALLGGLAFLSGRSAAWLARLVRDQEVEGSNPFAPTTFSLIFIGLLITLPQLPPKFVAHVAQITILEARNRVQLFLLGLAGSQHLQPVACHNGLPCLGLSAPSNNRSGFAAPHCVVERLHGNAGKH